MLLNLTTFNIRGQNDPQKVWKLRGYIKSVQPKIDMLLIQEHKLTGEKVSSLDKSLDPQAVYIHAEAEPRYNHTRNDQGAGCGGRAILLASKWSNTIAESGSCFQGQALWVILKDLPGGNIGILNVYSPNDQNERKQFWNELSLTLPRQCRWIVGGDFNMVEEALDKSSSCGRLLTSQEHLIWEGLKGELNIEDSFTHSKGLKYSWDNGRTQDQHILARLDRFYTFKEPATGNPRSVTSYIIQGEYSYSDHLLMNIQLKLGNSPNTKGCWKMNARLFEDTREEITKLWRSMPASRYSFFTKIHKVTRFYRKFYITKALEFKLKEATLKKELSEAQSQLQ
jgi:exonuclease III